MGKCTVREPPVGDTARSSRIVGTFNGRYRTNGTGSSARVEYAVRRSGRRDGRDGRDGRDRQRTTEDDGGRRRRTTRRPEAMSFFKEEKRTQYSPLMTREEQAEAVDDIEDTIDGETVTRRDGVGRNLSSSYAGGSSTAYREASDDAYETVPLRGAGRSLAQRATAHLKALKKSAKEVLKNAFSDSPSGPGSPSRTTTYGNAAYGGDNAVVGSPQRTGQLLSRAHARNRSLDLSHVLGTLTATIDGANTAAILLKEFRESGGDPEADQGTNDNLDLELSDVCEAHRAHLTQVAEMTDSSVSLSEEQLNTLLETLEKLNGAIFAIRAERNENAELQGMETGVVSTPTATGDEQSVSLGTSRIACATTEEEEEAMIAQAIAASLSVQPKEADGTAQAHAPAPEQSGAPSTPVRKQTNEDLLANLIDI